MAVSHFVKYFVNRGKIVSMERLLTEAETRELISQFLQEIRTKFGVTGKQIAEAAGVTQPTVSDWMNRKITGVEPSGVDCQGRHRLPSTPA